MVLNIPPKVHFLIITIFKLRQGLTIFHYSVQQECIPQAILGMDIICQAKSGMGKTAVFVLSVLQQMEVQEGVCNSLVLVHTREMAYQINQEFTRFSKYLPDVKVGVFYGGHPVKEHRAMLKDNCPNVVVGTPGRILQLVEEGHLKLDKLKRFILDECDSLLQSLGMLIFFGFGLILY